MQHKRERGRRKQLLRLKRWLKSSVKRRLVTLRKLYNCPKKARRELHKHPHRIASVRNVWWML